MKHYYTVMNSVVGELTLVASDEGLRAIIWEDDRNESPRYPEAILGENHPILKKAAEQLEEYFSGKRENFELPLLPEGTEYQKKIWKKLQAIPYGATWSYKDLAERTGNPKGARAAGGATGRNPLSIVIPCHRVVGSNGSLTGFGGGLNNKAILLDIEKRNRCA